MDGYDVQFSNGAPTIDGKSALQG